jgi:hypothetical protein
MKLDNETKLKLFNDITQYYILQKTKTGKAAQMFDINSLHYLMLSDALDLDLPTPEQEIFACLSWNTQKHLREKVGFSPKNENLGNDYSSQPEFDFIPENYISITKFLEEWPIIVLGSLTEKFKKDEKMLRYTKKIGGTWFLHPSSVLSILALDSIYRKRIENIKRLRGELLS